jgi:hypothetical protein
MEPFSLAIGASYCFGLCKVDLFRNPALRTVCKGRGFYIGTLDPEFPAVDTESTMSERLFLSGETLYAPFNCRYNPDIFIAHTYQISFAYFLFPLIIYQFMQSHGFYHDAWCSKTLQGDQYHTPTPLATMIWHLSFI